MTLICCTSRAPGTQVSLSFKEKLEVILVLDLHLTCTHLADAFIKSGLQKRRTIK